MSPITSDSSSSPSSKNLIEFTSNPQLAPRACDSCRKRKIKCDRKSNFCNQCFKNGTRCTYQDPIRKRGRPTKAKLNSLKNLIEAISTHNLHQQGSSDESDSTIQLPTPKTSFNDGNLWDCSRDDNLVLPGINTFQSTNTPIYCNTTTNSRFNSNLEEMPAYDLIKYSTQYQSLPEDSKNPIDFYKQFTLANVSSNTYHRSSNATNHNSFIWM